MSQIVFFLLGVFCLCTHCTVSSGHYLNARAILTKAELQKCTMTAADIDGPYYKPNAPAKSSLNGNPPAVCANTPANDRLFLNGTVYLTSSGDACGKPVKAVLDIWQADERGVYSNTKISSPDFGCRAQVMTDNDGKYQLSTIMPGRYNDLGGYRPAHVHFKITPLDSNSRPIGKTLTTQLYFAEDFYLSPRDSCGICGSGQPSLISHVEHSWDIKSYVGSWDVVLQS